MEVSTTQHHQQHHHALHALDTKKDRILRQNFRSRNENNNTASTQPENDLTDYENNLELRSIMKDMKKFMNDDKKKKSSNSNKDGTQKNNGALSSSTANENNHTEIIPLDLQETFRSKLLVSTFSHFNSMEKKNCGNQRRNSTNYPILDHRPFALKSTPSRSRSRSLIGYNDMRLLQQQRPQTAPNKLFTGASINTSSVSSDLIISNNENVNERRPLTSLLDKRTLMSMSQSSAAASNRRRRRRDRKNFVSNDLTNRNIYYANNLSSTFLTKFSSMSDEQIDENYSFPSIFVKKDKSGYSHILEERRLHKSGADSKYNKRNRGMKLLSSFKNTIEQETLPRNDNMENNSIVLNNKRSSKARSSRLNARKREMDKKRKKLHQKLQVGKVQLQLPPTFEDMTKGFEEKEKRRVEVKQRRDNLIEVQQNSILESIEKRDFTRVQRIQQKALQDIQKKQMKLIILFSRTRQWFDLADKLIHARRLDLYASCIQRRWKKRAWYRTAEEARITQVRLKRIGWRLRFWLRCTRRRLHAQLLRKFFTDFSVQQLDYIMYTFRYRVMKAQRLLRNFIECKRGRRQLLEKIYMEIEKNLTKEVHKRGARRRNALVPQYMQPNKSARLIALQAQSKTLLELASQQIHQTSIITGMPGERHAGGVKTSSSDASLVKILCRMHIENERRIHNNKSAAAMNDIEKERPELNVEHAKMLLSGQSIPINTLVSSKRHWPPFLLYSKGKRRLQKTVEEVLRDKNSVKARVDAQIESDYQIMMANRFASGLDYEDSSTDDGGEESTVASGTEASNSVATEMEKKDLEEKLRVENEELAIKFNANFNEVVELREIFNLVDLDSGGTIDAEELGKLLDLLGMHKDEDEIQEMLSFIDTTGKGEVMFADFVRALKGNRTVISYTGSMVKDAFMTFSKGMPNGHIHAKQLVDALCSFNGKWDSATSYSALRNAGLTNPNIDYSQYVHVMFMLCSSGSGETNSCSSKSDSNEKESKCET